MEEPYGAMLERWRHTPLKHLLSEGANAERIIRTINTTDAPLTPARKAALILADEHARLQNELAATRTTLESLLPIEERVEGGTCDDCGGEEIIIYRSEFGWQCCDCLAQYVVEQSEEL